MIDLRCPECHGPSDELRHQTQGARRYCPQCNLVFTSPPPRDDERPPEYPRSSQDRQDQ